MSRQRFAALIAAGILGAGTLAFGAAYVIHGFAVGTYFEPGVVSPADLPLASYRSTAETSSAPGAGRLRGVLGASTATVGLAENERVPDPPAIGIPVPGGTVLMAQLDIDGGGPGATLLVAQPTPAGGNTRETAPEASEASPADPAPDAAPSAGTPAPAVTFRGPQLGDAGIGFVSPASTAPGPDLALLQLPLPGSNSFGGLGPTPGTGTFPSVVPTNTVSNPASTPAGGGLPPSNGGTGPAPGDGRTPPGNGGGTSPGKAGGTLPGNGGGTPAPLSGRTPADPIAPRPQAPGETGFHLPLESCMSGCTGQDWRYFDPPVAVGFRYEMDPHSPHGVAKIKLPKLGDDAYDLFLFDVTLARWTDTLIDIAGDAEFDLIAALEGRGAADAEFLARYGLDPEEMELLGLYSFEILGIEPSVNLDPNRPDAFVTGLLFTGAVSGDLIITPLTIDTDDPDADPSNPDDHQPAFEVAIAEPGSLALCCVAGVALLAVRRRIRRPLGV